MLLLSVFGILLLSKGDMEWQPVNEDVESPSRALDQRLLQKKVDECKDYLRGLRVQAVKNSLNNNNKYQKFIQSLSPEHKATLNWFYEDDLGVINSSQAVMDKLKLIERVLKSISQLSESKGDDLRQNLDSLRTMYCNPGELNQIQRQRLQLFCHNSGFVLDCSSSGVVYRDESVDLDSPKTKKPPGKDREYKKPIDYSKHISLFFAAEDRQDYDAISKFYSDTIKVYYSDRNLLKADLMKRYKSIWSRTRASNELISVDSIGDRRYVITTKYTWESKNIEGEGGSTIDQLIIQFDEGYVREIYNK